MRRNVVLKKFSRDLRQEATPAEKILWPHLRGRRFADLKFRRQHIVGQFIVDFYCAEAQLVVELDGGTHLDKESIDKARQAALEAHGLKVLRFWNSEVYEHLEVVLKMIWIECQARRRPLTPRSLRSRRPSPQGERGVCDDYRPVKHFSTRCLSVWLSLHPRKT